MSTATLLRRGPPRMLGVGALGLVLIQVSEGPADIDADAKQTPYACGSRSGIASAASRGQSSSGIGSAASASVSATRSGRVTPTIVEVMRGSHSENWKAAAAIGTPNSRHTTCISRAAWTTCAGAAR
jgi:hypothetical protein